MKPKDLMGGMSYGEDYGDKGGASMGGGLGAGVESPGIHDSADAGYKCEAKFPLTGEFWTREARSGQA